MKKKPIIVIAVTVVLLITVIFALNNNQKNKPVEIVSEKSKVDEQLVKDSIIEETDTSNPNSSDLVDGESADQTKKETAIEDKQDKNKNESQKVTKQDKVKNEIETTVSKEGKNKNVVENKVVLNSLAKTGYEVQDNTITDTWGVVVVHAQLPAKLKDAESYKITIGDQVYNLKRNKYNSEVFSGQVSSVKHTKEEVQAGIITKD